MNSPQVVSEKKCYLYDKNKQPIQEGGIYEVVRTESLFCFHAHFNLVKVIEAEITEVCTDFRDSAYGQKKGRIKAVSMTNELVLEEVDGYGFDDGQREAHRIAGHLVRLNSQQIQEKISGLRTSASLLEKWANLS